MEAKLKIITKQYDEMGIIDTIEVGTIGKIFEKNKDIYVVPSNIFNKNSYFSNYLIKQGADILLNKQDIKFIVSRKRIY